MTNLTFLQDKPKPERTWERAVTDGLADLLAYAHAWNATQPPRRDSCTLTFSSMLAAMVAGPDDLCGWLRDHLARRGVNEDVMTRGQSYAPSPRPTAALSTTASFRAAEQEAIKLAGGAALDVRHFVAAYAVCDSYHREDFIRLRIDRRSWCIELADELARRFPSEAAQWQAYGRRAPKVRVPNFDADEPAGRDLLGVEREVEAFASLIAGTGTRLPLSIGIFGAWGAGKTYFMQRVHGRVAELAQAGSREHYLARIAQVSFNAWHYCEGNVVASMVDHIFRNLRFGREADDAPAKLADRRREVLAAIGVAEGQRLARKRDLEQAEARQREARLALEEAQRRAPADAAVAIVKRQLVADPRVAELAGQLERASKTARRGGLTTGHLLWGIVMLALAAIVTLALSLARDAKLLTGLLGVVAALAPIARSAFQALRDLADKGEAFQQEMKRLTAAAVEELAGSDEARQHATTALAAADAQVAEQQRTLAIVDSTDLLDELLGELGATDTFRSQLGILARARGHFETLSSRMRTARAAHHRDPNQAAPVLDRIVLYVDDLDRCPADKVREVLRAIHLLLAFDLFVCVVAADPRWVLQCLADSPGVGRPGTPMDEDFDVLGGAATPSDYLEKLIQIPLWLRPIHAAQRPALVATLLRQRPDDAIIATAGGDAAAPVDGDSAAGQAPERMAIDASELAFLPRIERLLAGNPRALKRFANTYRLVKSSISDVELEYFCQGGSRGIPHQICMAQLAILATQRTRARWLVRLVDAANNANPARKLGEWLAYVIKDGDTVVRATAPADRSPTSVDDERRLVTALAVDLHAVLLPDHATLTIEDFATWLGRTRRYSFYL